jgi:DNA repair protein RadC
LAFSIFQQVQYWNNRRFTSPLCTALKDDACGIIVAHNHPSGNLSANQADIALTNKLKEAGKFFEIQLLYHIIITTDSYTSIADEGLLLPL